jgi:septal ring factor EnvC (AmiA/AmiB activator)
MSAIAAVALLGGLLGTALMGVARADRTQDLERLRRAIQESRERVAGYEREERGLLETVEALDRSAALLSREVAHAGERAEEARAALAAIEAEAAELARRLEGTRRAMSRRAVALYRAGDVGPIQMLFSSGGLREFLSRVYALRLLLGHDAELIARHRFESEALDEAESRAREASARRDRAVAGLRERSEELRAERSAKRRLVARLHADRTRERTALVELETAARALEETLSGLRESSGRERAVVEGPPFATLQGELAPPVAAPIDSEFGRVVDAEFRTETFRKGVEFDAALGTEVRAVAAGQVRYAGWFRGYGKLVILDHGEEYFTVSGHLAEIEVEAGDEVSGGQELGTVGETGSLSGPRLYFEIRRGSEPLDPREWLRSPRAR